MEAILAGQFAGAAPQEPRTVQNPYLAEYRDTLGDATPKRAGAVCALKFSGPNESDYTLVDFGAAELASQAGFTVTHHGRCGSCSTLRDLAIYLEQPDLTAPARRCARKWGLDRIQACFIEEIGFTPDCAASWAYNALNTRKQCRSACIETYGLINLLLHRYPQPNNRPDGSLNACLQCDEEMSGPGFQYSAGRTRRNSGIESAIRRPHDAIQPVDHSAYFRPPSNEPR
jgi:hypothetical protein